MYDHKHVRLNRESSLSLACLLIAGIFNNASARQQGKKIHAIHTKPRTQTYSKTNVETDRLCATSENRTADRKVLGGDPLLECSSLCCVHDPLAFASAQDVLVSNRKDDDATLQRPEAARRRAPPRPIIAPATRRAGAGMNGWSFSAASRWIKMQPAKAANHDHDLNQRRRLTSPVDAVDRRKLTERFTNVPISVTTKFELITL